MFMFFILYWQTCICLRVSESISLSQKGFRLGKVDISALVMHSSKSFYSTFPFLFLLHILLKPLIYVVVRNGLWNIVFLIYFAVCGGAGKRKYLIPLQFNLCLDTSIHVFVFLRISPSWGMELFSKIVLTFGFTVTVPLA